MAPRRGVLRRGGGVAFEAVAGAAFGFAGERCEGLGAAEEADQFVIEEEGAGERGEAIRGEKNGPERGVDAVAQTPHDSPMERGQEEGGKGEPEQKGAEAELHG